MFTPAKLKDYESQYGQHWVLDMPQGVSPEDILISESQDVFRLTNSNMIQLTLDRILDYCDGIQIFTAQDAIGCNYLYLLYDDTTPQGDIYLGAQLSDQRLRDFVAGKADLRDLYVYPEEDNVHYRVEVRNSQIFAYSIERSGITEDMLPLPGYTFEPEEEAESTTTTDENYSVRVPARDR